MKVAALTLALTGLVGTVAAVEGITIQKPGLERTAEDVKRGKAVKKMFKESYEAYRKYAFGYDQLQPMRLNGVQTRNGWGATIVDAMDTMILMGLDDYYYEALDWVKSIDYSVSKVDQTVSVFETTIRYLGGMLAAHTLSPTEDQILIKQSKSLGNMLSHAWSKNTNVNYGFLNTSSGVPIPIVDNSNIAEAGTLILEFDELSRVSKNGTYRTLAELGMFGIMNEAHVLPGCPAQGINPKNATPVGDYCTWQGGSDSYFEYLLKYALLKGNEDPRYISEWQLAVDSLISKQLHRDSVKGLLYPADYSPSEGGLIYVYSHLECFMGGNILLGGQMLGNDTLKDIGLALTETCYNSYNATKTKIGPEGFCYIPKGKVNPVNGCNITSNADAKFYNKHGFAITAADYIMRPETVESYFYAYRITGDPVWKDRAWEAFQAIHTWTPGTVAYTGIVNVNKIPPGRYDDLESFYFAELMKYFYLIFADPETINLSEYVFNTEAHPFKIQKKTDSFSLKKMPSKTADFVFQAGKLPAPSGLPELRVAGTEVQQGTVQNVPMAPANATENVPEAHRRRAHDFH